MDKERHYFVYVVAVLLVGALGYFCYESFKPEVTTKKVDGETVLVSIDGYDLTKKELLEELNKDADEIKYNMWRNYVIDASVSESKFDEDDKENISNYKQNLRYQAQNTYGEKHKEYLDAIAKSQGLKNAEDYANIQMKLQHMIVEYGKEHWDDYKEKADELKPRVLHVIELDGAIENLDEIKAKIDKDIEKKKDFEAISKKYTNGIETEVGYVDTTTLPQMSLGDEATNAILELEEDGITDWIETTDANSGTTTWYRYKVTNLGAEKNKEEKTLYVSLISDSTEIEKVIYDYSKKLNFNYSEKGFEELIEKTLKDKGVIEEDAKEESK